MMKVSKVKADVEGKIDVKNKTAESVVINWDLNDAGQAEKLKLHIGGTNAVSDEFRDIVGGQFNVNKRSNDIADLLEAVLTGDVDGVKLASLTTDSVVLELTNGAGVTDTMTIVGTAVEALIADLDGSLGIAAIGDTDSAFHIIESGEEVLNGNVSDEGDLSPDGAISNKGGSNGPEELQDVLEAALDQTNENVKLLGLEDDEFTVAITDVDKKGDEQTDILIFKDTDKTNVADAIDAVAQTVALNDGAGTAVLFPEAGASNDTVLGNPVQGSETRGEFGNAIKENELADLIAFAATSDEVTAYDQGDNTLVIVDSGAAPDIIIVDDGFLG